MTPNETIMNLPIEELNVKYILYSDGSGCGHFEANYTVIMPTENMVTIQIIAVLPDDLREFPLITDDTRITIYKEAPSMAIPQGIIDLKTFCAVEHNGDDE